jgi:hypothetical protein
MAKQFTVEIRDITTIRPYEKNPRLNDKAVAAVAASLKEFGFRQPLVVDKEGVLIAGHTRLKASLLLGLKIHRMRRPHSRATCGYWATTGFCAAMREAKRILTGCWMET